MELDLLFGLLGGIIVLAFVANRLFRYTRIPDLLLLIGVSVLLGPVLHSKGAPGGAPCDS